MKKSLLALLCILTIYSCSKIKQSPQPIDNVKASVSAENITLLNGKIPHYADAATYEATLNALTSDYQSNLLLVSQDSVNSDSLASEDYRNLAWDLYDRIESPLVEFEASIGLNSKRAELHTSVRTWLENQGEILDTLSHPDSLGFSHIEQTLMNDDGDYAVEDTLYHADTNSTIIKIVGTSHASDLSDYSQAKRTGSFSGTVQQWFAKIDPRILVIALRPPYNDLCQTNKSAQIWISVDSKTKFKSDLTWSYNGFTTSSFHQIMIYAKIKIFFVSFWVPALTSSQCSGFSFSYDPYCLSKTYSHLPTLNLWGPFNFSFQNFSLQNRKIRSSQNATSEGFWGEDKVKYMNFNQYTSINF